MRRVYAYVAYRLGDGPESEDVTSAVFENAVRYRDTYDRSKGEPVTWLLGIARRCIAQALVGRPEGAGQPGEGSRSTEFEPDAIERLTLDTALRELSERDRELIGLRYGADLQARQIAEVVGLTTNAVEVALHRALARLRTTLEAQEGTGGPAPAVNPAKKPV